MSLQKFRADFAAEPFSNGGVPWFTRSFAGQTLAKISNCIIHGGWITPRTVYVTGQPDTWFSIPAACVYRRRIIRGYITADEDSGGYHFRVFDFDKEVLRVLIYNSSR